MCAICIGLGGSPSILGRARDLGEYVRRGARGGWVEITLSTGPRSSPVVLRRDLTAGSNASEWRLDGAPARAADAAAAVARAGVQLDNLCQFLPQDRVADFARLTPAQLLAETERASGEEGLVDAHAAAAAAAADARAARAGRAALADEVEAAGRQQEATRRDAELAERRERAARTARAARCKRAAARAAAARDEEATASEALATAAANLRAARIALDRASAGGGEAERACRERARRTADGARAAEAALERDAEEADDVAARVDAARRTLAKAPDIRAARERQLQERRAAVESARARLAALPAAAADDPAAASRQVAADAARDAWMAAKQDAEAAEGGRRRAEADARDAACSAADAASAAAAAGNARARIASALNIADVVRGVDAAVARGDFEGPVFGPLAAELRAARGAGGALEAALALDMLTRYVVTTARDQDRVRDAAWGRVAVSLVPRGGGGAPVRRLPPSVLAALGADSTLDAAVTAPAEIMRVLHDDGGLHLFAVAPRGGEAELRAADAAGRAARGAPPLRGVVLGGTRLVRLVRSRYDADAVTTVTAGVGPPRALESDGGGGSDVAARSHADAVAARAAADAATARAAEADGTERAARAANQAAQRAADTAAKAGDKARQALAAAEAMLAAELARPGVDTEVEAEKVKLAGAAADAEGLAARLAAAARSHRAAVYSAAVAGLAAAEAAGTAVARVDAVAEARAAVARREAVADRLATNAAAATAAAAAAAADATAARADVRPDDEPTLAADMAALPDDDEALAAAADEADAEAGGVSAADGAALARWRARARELDALAARAATASADVAALTARAEESTARWAPRAAALVAAVGAAFAGAMRGLGCDGAVDFDGGGEDPSAAAARVSVRFRGGEALARLDGARQSGGERAVATVLYILALQSRSVAPFRVIDEINQGMDPVNERAVFGLLATGAAADGAPQCLLLTPKLLPGLPYTGAVTVLQVVNGRMSRGAAAAPVKAARMLSGVGAA